MLNAFSVDVEDYYQVTGFESHVRREQWDDFPSRVVASTRRLLDLLADAQTQATFYVLGWVAHKHPQLVREIAAAGHELGSHSYWHRQVTQQTPDEFRRDLRDSRSALEDAAGLPIALYRAPPFRSPATRCGPSTSWPRKAFAATRAFSPSGTTATASPTPSAAPT